LKRQISLKGLCRKFNTYFLLYSKNDN